jgi:hypothetical protein
MVGPLHLPPHFLKRQPPIAWVTCIPTIQGVGEKPPAYPALATWCGSQARQWTRRSHEMVRRRLAIIGRDGLVEANLPSRPEDSPKTRGRPFLQATIAYLHSRAPGAMYRSRTAIVEVC